MSEEKKDFFDYDTYIQNNVGKIKNGSGGKSKKPEHVKPPRQKAQKPQKPPKLVPADEAADKPRRKQERDSIESIKKMFGEALDESKEELAEFTGEEPVPDSAPEVNPEGLRRKLYYLFGIVISLLAVVGLVSTVNFSIAAVKNFADNTQQKNEFAKFVYPIVICDPAPFDQTVRLRNDTLITAALWDIILYEDKSKYDADFDMMIVPEVDVEQHGTKLFGTGLSFEHESILGAGVQFYYDEEIKSYRVPENPKYFTYSPYIEEISRVGERYTVTVGYVSPTPAWLTLTDRDEPEPEKYVDYIVSKRGGDMTLIAIQQSDRVVESPHEL